MTRNRTNSGTAMLAVAAAVVTVLAYNDVPASAREQAAVAAQPRAQAPGSARRFRATRPIIVDRQTGQRRMPTVGELTELLGNLSALTARGTDTLQEVRPAAGGVGVNLEGGFGGVMLARPNEDGTFETLCVFTFDEGAAFLGLVVENQ